MKHLSKISSILIGILLIIVADSSFAQKVKDIAKFGNCSKEELELQHCTFDSIAEAEVLFDVGDLYFDDSYNCNLERRLRVKVYTKAGLDQAEINIPFLKGIQKISSLKGNTYNLVNGNIETTSLNTKNTFDEQVAENWYQRKIAMPNVKEGSVFEISYTLTANGSYTLPTWDFQTDIPVLYSRLDATFDPRYTYTQILRGDKPFDDFQSSTTNIRPVFINNIPYSRENFKFIMKEIPAFNDESFITSANDYKIRLDFQLAGYRNRYGIMEPVLSTWPKLCEGLFDAESFGSFIKSCERAGKDLISENKLDTMSLTNRVKWVDKYIKTNFEYNNTNTFVSTKSCKQLLDQKTGSSGDLNLMAVGLLRAVGADTDPVILSTRSHGKIQTAYPFLEAFNYTVALVNLDSALYIVDVTEPLLNFGEIPTRCLNDQGMLVRKDNIDWIEFESNFMSDNRHEIELTINPALDSLQAEIKLSSSGYEAVNKRKLFKTDYKELAEDLLGRNYLSYDSINCLNLMETAQPLQLHFSRPFEVENIDDNLLIDPFCGMIVTENPLKQTERSYPIDFTYKFSRTFSININIPKGYRLLTTPDNLIVNNKHVRIVYTVTNQDPEKVTITAVYQFKKDVYPAADYLTLKGYYDQIVSKFNEKIILEKTGI